MLFASSSSSFGNLVFLLLIGVGFMRMGKLLSGNGAVKGAVKDGALSILGRMFRK